ncbi:DUF3000 domain-containing protein [Pseudonocardia acaciae]|uniref:DUF3000 domain-containing protein n=1 Tax=Pseudonocardia acaciae TaxID=551276 RepID=UPI00048AD804
MPSIVVSPPIFRQAVDALRAVQPRPELRLVDIAAPRRLAPHSFALGVELADDVHTPVSSLDADVDATGRLVLLYDPDARDAWAGTFRMVCYLRAPLDVEQADDPLLLAVGWSWLTDALDGAYASYTALGGTVTRTCSARFGDIPGPTRSDDVELRASWTPTDSEFGRHAEAFYRLVTHAIGLPEVGVSLMTDRHS